MAQELLKIPDFKNMRFFHYNGLSESFDIDTFFQYLKDNRRTEVSLWYKRPLSDEYKEKLQAITDEILDAELPRPYKTPLIQFDGQTRALELFVKHVFV
uniref:Uncharacterized protein n=1 Tax=Panagrolaimus sp. ES5 TaxID=591445 RepID=A0AC34FI86_9BILA